MKIVKLLILFISVAIALSMVYGFYLKQSGNSITGDRIIGLCILAASFVLMPLFMYYRWKGKDLRRYMLTPENLERMNNPSIRDAKKSEKQ